MTSEADVNIQAFLRDVGGFIDARGLIPPRSAVVVGVSGGADSVALLEVLRRLGEAPGRGYRLTVAHLNHGLRELAEADADFVAGLARRWDLPCVMGRRDVRAEARAQGGGIEQAARMARYEFLQEAAASAGASHVAVAHHADDNVETVLYRIVRGTHLRGLCGMPAQRPLGGGAGAILIRPLLERTREDIEAFCRSAGLAWRTDATNADTAYRRNFIRHELLPLLRSRLNRRADEAILRLAQAAAGADEVLGALARSALARGEGVSPLRIEGILPSQVVSSGESAGDTPAGRKGTPPSPRRCDSPAPFAVLDASVLAREHPLVQTVAIRMVLERLGAPMRSVDAGRLAEIQAMLAGAGASAVALPGGWTARMEEGRLVLARPAPGGTAAPAQEPAPAPQAAVLECPGVTRLADGVEIACRVEPFDAAVFERHRHGHLPGEELLDAGQVRGRLLCRPRQRGDCFVPLGAPGRQSVSDFLTNGKVPPRDRDQVRCICDELGIVYLAPLRIDDRVKVTPRTAEVLRIVVRPPGR